MEHHREISIRQIAAGIPPDDATDRLIAGLCYLAELAIDYDITPLVLGRLILGRTADARIQLHQPRD